VTCLRCVPASCFHSSYLLRLVLHAQDYQTLLSQLEHSFTSSPQFSLQKLWFYVHPTIHTLSLIYQLTLELGTADDPSASLYASSSSSSSQDTSDAEAEARNEALGLGGAKLKAVLSEIDKNGLDVAGTSGIAVKGGEVLTIIYERMQNMSGDPTAATLYGTLLRAAGGPYVAMLRVWVMTGRLVDPYEELLVKESKFINRGILEMDYTDEYWERRYTVGDSFVLTYDLGLVNLWWIAARWVNVVCAIEATPGGGPSAEIGRRPIACGSLCAASP
jgi:gamma-tubulin complex component 2